MLKEGGSVWEFGGGQEPAEEEEHLSPNNSSSSIYPFIHLKTGFGVDALCQALF